MKALRACFGFADGPVDAHCTHAKLDTAAPTTSRRLRKEQGPQHLDVRQCGERALPFPGDAIRPEQYQREHQDSKGARSEMVAESTPMAVTVFTLQPFGTVVHQNAASRSAYGDLACEVLPNHLLGAGLRAGPDEVVEDGDAACSDWDYYRRASADDALSQVFDLEPQQLSAMLQELQRGAAGSRVWRGIIRFKQRTTVAPSSALKLQYQYSARQERQEQQQQQQQHVPKEGPSLEGGHAGGSLPSNQAGGVARFGSRPGTSPASAGPRRALSRLTFSGSHSNRFARVSPLTDVQDEPSGGARVATGHRDSIECALLKDAERPGRGQHGQGQQDQQQKLVDTLLGTVDSDLHATDDAVSCIETLEDIHCGPPTNLLSSSSLEPSCNGTVRHGQLQPAFNPRACTHPRKAHIEGGEANANLTFETDFPIPATTTFKRSSLAAAPQLPLQPQQHRSVMYKTWNGDLQILHHTAHTASLGVPAAASATDPWSTSTFAATLGAAGAAGMLGGHNSPLLPTTPRADAATLFTRTGSTGKRQSVDYGYKAPRIPHPLPAPAGDSPRQPLQKATTGRTLGRRCSSRVLAFAASLRTAPDLLSAGSITEGFGRYNSLTTSGASSLSLFSVPPAQHAASGGRPAAPPAAWGAQSSLDMQPSREQGQQQWSRPQRRASAPMQRTLDMLQVTSSAAYGTAAVLAGGRAVEGCLAEAQGRKLAAALALQWQQEGSLPKCAETPELVVSEEATGLLVSTADGQTTTTTDKGMGISWQLRGSRLKDIVFGAQKGSERDGEATVGGSGSAAAAVSAIGTRRSWRRTVSMGAQQKRLSMFGFKTSLKPLEVGGDGCVGQQSEPGAAAAAASPESASCAHATGRCAAPGPSMMLSTGSGRWRSVAVAVAPTGGQRLRVQPGKLQQSISPRSAQQDQGSRAEQGCANGSSGPSLAVKNTPAGCADCNAPAPGPALAAETAAETAADAAAAAPAAPECWHEVWVVRAVDPITAQDVLVLAQHDVTAKVLAERHLALVMETEHRLLEQLFPRHILQHITEEYTAEAAARLAQHQQQQEAGARGAGSAVRRRRAEWGRPAVRDYTSLATCHSEVTLLFADIKGFTPMCSAVQPREVMAMLNDLFSRFDAMLDRFGVFKIETIGDCYFVAGGLIREDEDGMTAVRGADRDPLHARNVFMFAKAMLAAAREVRLPRTEERVQIRIGIHSGPVVSGVVGTRMPRFCLFGDTVNTASRMESSGVPGCVHASETAHALLQDDGEWVPRGTMEVKGKGLMRTFLYTPPITTTPADTRQSMASGLQRTRSTALAPSVSWQSGSVRAGGLYCGGGADGCNGGGGGGGWVLGCPAPSRAVARQGGNGDGASGQASRHSTETQKQ